jgi:heme-degrading monooxygenase HmoA
MVVRATEAEIDVVRRSPDDAIVVFEDSVLPALREQDGFEGCYVLLSEEGKMLVLTFWEDREAARTTRQSGFYEAQVAKFGDLVLYRQQPGREMYDVVVAEAPQPAVV